MTPKLARKIAIEQGWTITEVDKCYGANAFRINKNYTEVKLEVIIYGFPFINFRYPNICYIDNHKRQNVLLETDNVERKRLVSDMDVLHKNLKTPPKVKPTIKKGFKRERQITQSRIDWYKSIISNEDSAQKFSISINGKDGAYLNSHCPYNRYHYYYNEMGEFVIETLAIKPIYTKKQHQAFWKTFGK